MSSEPVGSNATTAVFLRPGNLFFLFCAVAGAIAFYSPLKELIIFSFNNGNYSHMPFIPFISGYFFWRKRRTIFAGARRTYFPGLVLMVLSLAPYLAGKSLESGISENDYLFFTVLAAVCFFLGSFMLFFGIDAFKAASFPLLFLFFMVPIPLFILNKIIFYLQTASAYGTAALLKMIGIPFLHKGFRFDYPGLSIYIAHECSGIRSSVSLLVMGVIMSQLYLEKWSGRLLFLLAVVPLSVVKNAIRIVTLSLLSLYVNPGFMYGNLHRKGGIVFFLIALGLLGLLIRPLKRLEKPKQRNAR